MAYNPFKGVLNTATTSAIDYGKLIMPPSSVSDSIYTYPVSSSSWDLYTTEPTTANPYKKYSLETIDYNYGVPPAPVKAQEPIKIWSVNELRGRQNYIDTNTPEFDQLESAVKHIAEIAANKKLKKEDLYYTVVFNTQNLVDNSQKIDINLIVPASLQIVLLKKIVQSVIVWSSDITCPTATPPDVVKRLQEANINGINKKPSGKRKLKL